MKRISEAEAYRQWHAEERQKAKLEALFRKIRKDLDWLEGQLADSLARQRLEDQERRTRDLVERMLHDKAFAKVLKAYTGHTPHGWRVACGCDGRMKKLADDWPVLNETIRRVRIAKGMAMEPRRCEARVMPDATLQLKIQLGYGG
jgi:hypothetical protein